MVAAMVAKWAATKANDWDVSKDSQRGTVLAAAKWVGK